MKNRYKFLLGLVAWPLAGALQAQTDTVRTLVDTLEQIVYIAPAGAVHSVEPITTNIISRSDVLVHNVGQEPSFILSRLVPSMTVYSDAGTTQGYSYMRLRGIDQTRINFSLMGIPMNEPEDQGAYFSNYPDVLAGLSQVIVQRGLSLSNYGVASYAGSVNLMLDNQSLKKWTQVGLGYGAYNSYRGFVHYNSGYLPKQKLIINARAAYLHSDGYRRHSDNTSQSAFLNVTYLPKPKHTLRFMNVTGHQANQMAWLGSSDSLMQIDPRHNANSEQEKDNFFQMLNSINYLWQVKNRFFWETQAYYTHLRGNYDFDFNNYLGLPSTNELYNYAFLSHWLGGFSNFRIEKENLTFRAGIGVSQYQRQHLGSEKTLGELYRNTGYKRDLSAFVRYSQTRGKWVFLADLQVRQARFAYKGAVPLDIPAWNFLNPRIGVTYRLVESSGIYASIGRTSREPTRNDIFMGNDDLLGDSLGLAVIGSTKAEQVGDIELGAFVRSDALKATLNGFFMQFNNEIVLNGAIGPNGLVLTDNVDNSFRTGVEFDFTLNLNGEIYLQHTTAYTYSRIKDQNISFSPILTPKVIVNQSIVYEGKENPIFAMLGCRYQSSSYIDLANTAKIGNYFLLDAQVGFRHKGWRLTLHGNNLLNTKYYNNAYLGYDGQGRYFRQAPINYYLLLTKTFY